jgi:transcriptional regulator with XRE-family HTH domain
MTFKQIQQACQFSGTNISKALGISNATWHNWLNDSESSGKISVNMAEKLEKLGIFIRVETIERCTPNIAETNRLIVDAAARAVESRNYIETDKIDCEIE